MPHFWRQPFVVRRAVCSVARRRAQQRVRRAVCDACVVGAPRVPCVCAPPLNLCRVFARCVRRGAPRAVARISARCVRRVCRGRAARALRVPRAFKTCAVCVVRLRRVCAPCVCAVCLVLCVRCWRRAPAPSMPKASRGCHAPRRACRLPSERLHLMDRRDSTIRQLR